MIYFVLHYYDKKMTWTNFRGKSLYYLQSIMKELQGRNMEVLIEAKNMGEYYFLTCFLWLAQLPFSYSSELLDQNRCCSHELGLSTKINKQVNAQRHVHRPIQWKQYVNWGSIFPDVSHWQPKLTTSASKCNWVLWSMNMVYFFIYSDGP